MVTINNYKIIKSSDNKEWDDFVNSHTFGRFSQLTYFQKAILKSYHLKSYNIGFYDIENNLNGILPTTLIKDYFGRKKLVSMPFSDYGGFLFNKETTIENKLVMNALDHLLDISGANILEIRGNLIGVEKPDDYQIDKIFFHNAICESALLKIKDREMIYKELAYSVKKNLKRAKKRRLVCNNNNSEEIIKNTFYPLYIKKMKQFGTPIHSLKYFLNLREYYGDNLIILIAEHNDECVSILFGIKSSNILNILSTISFGDNNKLRANDFLHWEMIKYSIANKCKLFDFGVARYEGQKRFKSKWNPKFINYSYYLYPRSIGVSKHKVFIDESYLNKIWAKFIPNNLSKIIGPIIRKVTGR